MINPIVEYHAINQWLARFVNRSITPENFVRRLSKYLNQSHRLRMRLMFNNELLDRGDFTFGGLYEPSYDEEHRKPLILFFYINHPSNRLWKISQETVDTLSLELIETITHEYRHLHQFRSRGFMVASDYRSRAEDVQLREEQEYLGSPDEIDAYAMNIAVRHFLGHNQGHDLEKYLRVFGDHPVTRRLRKKIYKNLDYLTSL